VHFWVEKKPKKKVKLGDFLILRFRQKFSNHLRKKASGLRNFFFSESTENLLQNLLFLVKSFFLSSRKKRLEKNQFLYKLDRA
jgi:hypothetical protein